MIVKNENHKNLSIVSHPIIEHQLCILRDIKSNHRDYKEALKLVCLYMAPFLTAHLATEEIDVETPLETMKGKKLTDEDPVIVPILRAGLGLSEPLKEMLPFAKSGHVGVYRDPETKEAVEYLVKIPKTTDQTQILLVDPMLATGNSAIFSLDSIVKRGVKPQNIKMMVLVAAPEGVKHIEKSYPEIEIFTAVLDRELNDHAYIVPGLGDAGDRLFGTI